ncbi:MFS transporter [Massilia sp. H-1]|nr:MFS transporter [Massilia sp. H-1]
MRGPQILLTVFLPFALGHFLSALLRTVNAVLAPSLVASLGLSPGQLGLLTSALFLAFALVQLPVGMALDRYGPRRVQVLLLMVAAGGALLFAHGTTFVQLVAARAIIGAGLGGCFMSAVKAISASFPCLAKLPSVQGYMIAVGGLGAASATLPVRLALDFTDWRGVFTLLAALAAALRAADLVCHAAQRAAARHPHAHPAVGAGGLPRPRVSPHRLADADSARRVLRSAGTVDRALAVRHQPFFGSRCGLAAVPEHGRRHLRFDRGRHAHRMGRAPRHRSARRGRDRHRPVPAGAAGRGAQCRSRHGAAVGAVLAGGHHRRTGIRDRRPEHACRSDGARVDLSEPAHFCGRVRGAGQASAWCSACGSRTPSAATRPPLTASPSAC